MRERRLKIAIAAAFFAGLALSPKLWISERVYPQTPVWAMMRPIPPPLDYLLYGAMLALLIVIALAPRPAKWIWAFVLVAITLALFDQSRWQPWFYQYLIMLIAVGLGKQALNTCRLVMVCTYFWSGLQKTNGDFIHSVFPNLLGPLAASVPAAMAYAAPLIEVAIGVGLLTRFRKYAIYGGIAMHAFILLAIGPFGQNTNSVVWPWNIAMICFLLILFWERPNLYAREILWPSEGIFQRVVLVLLGILPALSFFNLWDGYLSSALYSGVRNNGVIYVTDPLKARLPQEITAHLYASNKPGTDILILREWAMGELNAGINAEPRIYKSVARAMCTYVQDPSELKLWIKQSNVLFSADKQVSYDCPSLGK